MTKGFLTSFRFLFICKGAKLLVHQLCATHLFEMKNKSSNVKAVQLNMTFALYNKLTRHIVSLSSPTYSMHESQGFVSSIPHFPLSAGITLMCRTPKYIIPHMNAYHRSIKAYGMGQLMVLLILILIFKILMQICGWLQWFENATALR